MPIAVFDTNVLVAGLRSKRGASNRLLELVAKQGLRMQLSVPLVLEYEAVLRRQAKALDLTYRDISDLVDFICQTGAQHTIHFMWRPVLKDPNDDMVLELAIAAVADIITFNAKDFKAANRFGVRIWEPGVFLKHVEGRS